ncbi:MAG: lipopolysaccharide biosynthesis protein [Alphaproteobacteria bacterium]|nr:lipopolysaccharide biosynthesis protein [Alphaproteobacteria bacterium]
MKPSDAAKALATDHLLTDLRGRSVRGGAVTFGAQAGKVVLQLATVVVLVRMLPPGAFGLIAMVAALSAVLEFVKELGLSAATIRETGVTHAQVSALFWINAAVGASIAVVLFLAAPLIADFYHRPEVTSVTRWLALSFLMSGLTVQHWALLRRQMRFTATICVDIGGDLAGLIAAVLLALSGAGYWALVVQRLVVPAVALIGSWSLCRWRPARPRRAAGVRELFAFGLSVTGVNITAAVSRSIDQILIGWAWGADVLGLYERASKLLLTPVNNLAVPVYAVGLPTLSRIAHQDARYRRAFNELFENLAMVVLPSAALLAATADWAVRILFGVRWSAAAPLVAWFAASAAFLPLLQAAGLLYLSQNRPYEMVRAGLVDLALCVLAVAAGLHAGAVAVAGALAIVGLGLRLPIGLWLATRRGPVRLGDLSAALVPALTAALATGATVVALRRFVLRATTPALPGALLAILAAATAAAAIYAILPRSRRALYGLGRLVHELRRQQPALKT